MATAPGVQLELAPAPEKKGLSFGWPRALNGIGDGKVLFGDGKPKPNGDGEKPSVKQFIQDALAGTTVAMILVPEAVAFSFMAGLNPLIGLQAAWIMCLVAGLVGDRPAMISGATGAVAVVLPQITQVDLCTDYLVKRYDMGGDVAPPCIVPTFATPRRLGMLFYAVMLQGLLQFVFGLFKLGKVALLLPEPTMVGFCNGLGIIIFFAQFAHFKRGEIGMSTSIYCQNAFDKGDGATFLTTVNMTTQQWCSTASGQENFDGGAFAWTNSTSGRRQLGGSHAVFSDGEPWHDSQTLLYMVFALVIPVIFFIHAAPELFKRLPGKNPQLIPSSLVGIGMSIVIEHLILRNVDSDCDLVRNANYDFDNTGEDPRALWIGCGTKTVSEIAMVAGKFPVPFWFDSKSYETFPGSGVSIELRDAIPPLDGDLLSEIFPVACFLAIIGLIESLMTQILLNQMLGTPGDASRECVGQGVANLASGALGSMGGCVTIGQAMINVGSGAKLRFSSCWAAFILLLIVLVGYPIIDLIPVAGLVGVMFDMVAFHIFNWGSLKMMLSGVLPVSVRKMLRISELKVSNLDSATIVVVAVVSIFSNLAIGVGCGVVLQSLAFAWNHGGDIQADTGGGTTGGGITGTMTWDNLNEDEQEAAKVLGLTQQKWDVVSSSSAEWEKAGSWPVADADADEAATDEAKKKQEAAKVLGWTEENWHLVPSLTMHRDVAIRGTLFFGSARVLQELFPADTLDSLCPKYVNLDMSASEVVDLSAIAALDALGDMLKERNKVLHVSGLSAASERVMRKGQGLASNVASFSQEPRAASNPTTPKP